MAEEADDKLGLRARKRVSMQGLLEDTVREGNKRKVRGSRRYGTVLQSLGNKFWSVEMDDAGIGVIEVTSNQLRVEAGSAGLDPSSPPVHAAPLQQLAPPLAAATAPAGGTAQHPPKFCF